MEVKVHVILMDMQCFLLKVKIVVGENCSQAETLILPQLLRFCYC